MGKLTGQLIAMAAAFAAVSGLFRSIADVRESTAQQQLAAVPAGAEVPTGGGGGGGGGGMTMNYRRRAVAAEAETGAIPLPDLTRSYGADADDAACPPPLVAVRDRLLSPSLAYAGGRKIPRIVHLSSKSRCNHPVIAANAETWKLKGHSLFLHDDEAVWKLLNREWPEFPGLRAVLTCLPSTMGAHWIDVWRILVLWEYGGIFADIDTSPVPDLFNETTITSNDDAFFVVETLGSPSQWFMAASPRHPMMYLSMQALMRNVIEHGDLGKFKVVFTTGPGAINDGFRDFVGGKIDGRRYHYNAVAGRYDGVGMAANRTVTIAGEKANENMYITRVIDALKSNAFKNKIYETTNMTHLTAIDAMAVGKVNTSETETCKQRLASLADGRAAYVPSWSERDDATTTMAAALPKRKKKENRRVRKEGGRRRTKGNRRLAIRRNADERGSFWV